MFVIILYIHVKRKPEMAKINVFKDYVCLFSNPKGILSNYFATLGMKI